MAKLQPKAVICVETGDEYQSSGAAGRAFGIDPSGILKCCKGLAKTAAGHTWKFADEVEDDDDQCDDENEDDDYEQEEDNRTVADFMKENPVSIKASTSLAVAEHFMLEGDFLRLPVVDDNNKLVGIVTQHDIQKKKAEIAEFTDAKFLDPELPIEKFVKSDIIMTTPDEPASEISRAAADFNAKFLPVIKSKDDRTLVGIVTYFDYLNNL